MSEESVTISASQLRQDMRIPVRGKNALIVSEIERCRAKPQAIYVYCKNGNVGCYDNLALVTILV